MIIGELINTSRKPILEAVQKQDADYIKKIAQDQVAAGATYVDVNCGTMIGNESEMMRWLVETVQEAVQVPLCIDSPDPQVLDLGLSLCKFGQPMINSLSGEKERYAQILPLVQKYKAKIVVLCMDDQGMPTKAEDRLRVVRYLVPDLVKAGVPMQDIYLDPLIIPVGTDDQAALQVHETLRQIKAEFPEVNTVCGLSNVSYGLPNRKVLNQTFMIQTMTAGMDAYILNPLDRTMMGFYVASRALLGKDEYCLNYISAHREGLFDTP
jgi:cobalamin-dependent methionine synthase I